MEQPTKIFESPRIEKLSALFLVVLTVFVALLALGALMNLFEPRPAMGNIISVQGMGSVTVIPDVAVVSFSITENAENASGAQDLASKKINVALAVLGDDLGIEERDIKTVSYSVYPRYNRAQPCFADFCPEYIERIIGYTASQVIEVKVRDTAKVGEVLARLGDVGVSNLSGPHFTVDDPDVARAEARALAVSDAREKAEALADSLNVRLVRVSGFWEEGPYVPYERAMKSSFDGYGGAEVPGIPVGEGEVNITVNVSYEIR